MKYIRLKTDLEMILTMAVVVIHNESSILETKKDPLITSSGILL